MKFPQLKRLRRFKERLPQRLDALDRLRRPTRNVVVVSYPKSGRTWLRFMLTRMGMNLLFVHAGAENRLGRPLEDIRDLPGQYRDRRIVFLFRDPRDTVVSSYFQATKRLKPKYRFEGTMSEFVRSPNYGIGKVAGFNLLWLESSWQFRDFMAVSYEDLHLATDRQVRRVVEFAEGKRPDESRLQDAVEAGRFDNMRKIENSIRGKRDDRSRLGGGDPDDQESLKTRKGKVGGWSDYFDEEDTIFIERTLADLDYWQRVHAALRTVT